MRKAILALAAVLSILLCGWTHGVPTPSGNYALLLANKSAPGYTIPSTFVGFAWNKGAGGFTSGYFTTADTSLITIMQTVGSTGTFRVGGTPCASSEGAATSSASIQAMHDMLAAVGSGWLTNVVWCLNMQNPTMGSNDIAYAETEVGYVESIFGSGVVTYAIGNEPDLYYSGESAFQSQWQTFYAAVSAAYPSAKFSGPELAAPITSGVGWTAAFAHSASGEVALLTDHYYTTGQATWTVANLLPQQAMNLGPQPTGHNLYAGSFLYHDGVGSVPIRLDETNTIVTSGGTSGVSNAAVSADWVVNLAIALANAKWTGFDLSSVCFTSVNTYSPVNSLSCTTSPTWVVNPEVAGLELASDLGGSQVLPVTETQSPNANVNALGVLTMGGNVAFLVANLDTTNAVSIVPQSTASWSTATATIVGSTSPSDLTIQINGVVMSSSTGACSTTCPPTTYAKGAAIPIPAGGAAYVVLQ